MVIDQINSCLGSSGCTGGKVDKLSGGRLFQERAMFASADSVADIVIDLEGRGTRQPSGGFNTSYLLVLKIRTPTLFTPSSAQ